ncbi:MAG: hypothetical protein ACE5G9_07480 [Nitrospinales bacterium]
MVVKKVKSWEELVNDGANYGNAEYSPTEKILVECIKNKTVLKIQDSFLFSKTGDIPDPDHGKKLAQEIARFEPLKNITSLIITHNALGAAGMKCLAESTILTQLKSLHLGSNKLGDEGVKILAEAPLFSGVEDLNLECNAIKAEGARALARSPHLTRLTHLNLVDNRIGDEGALAIAESPNFKNLVYLHLGGNRIKSEGAKQALRQSPNLPRLQTLKIF